MTFLIVILICFNEKNFFFFQFVCSKYNTNKGTFSLCGTNCFVTTHIICLVIRAEEVFVESNSDG